MGPDHPLWCVNGLTTPLGGCQGVQDNTLRTLAYPSANFESAKAFMIDLLAASPARPPRSTSSR